MAQSGIKPDIKATRDGLLLLTRGTENYRKAVEVLKMSEVPAHWSQLKEDRPLIKAIPAGIEEYDIREQLEGQGFRVGSVVRLRKSSTCPYDIAAVTLENSEE